MKETIVRLTAFSLLGVAALFAQSSTVKAYIPFDFTVGNTVLPSGQYMVSFGGHQNAIMARASSGKTGVISLTNLVTRNDLGEGKLVFNVYGDRYFLSKIWVPGLATGREVVKSKSEKESMGYYRETGLAAIRATLP